MSSTNRGSTVRDPRDFYRTPAWAVEVLYKTINLPDPTYDPCAGNGGLLEAVKGISPGTFGRRIYGTELHEELVQEARAAEHMAVLGDGLARGWQGEHVLMNPPYETALAWVTKGSTEAITCAALVRLGFLASQKRAPFWKANPPSVVGILPKRPSFRSDGKTDSADYCWVVWGQFRTGKTDLVWL